MSDPLLNELEEIKMQAMAALPFLEKGGPHSFLESKQNSEIAQAAARRCLEEIIRIVDELKTKKGPHGKDD